jgi:hypothetical protein
MVSTVVPAKGSVSKVKVDAAAVLPINEDKGEAGGNEQTHVRFLARHNLQAFRNIPAEIVQDAALRVRGAFLGHDPHLKRPRFQSVHHPQKPITNSAPEIPSSTWTERRSGSTRQ